MVKLGCPRFWVSKERFASKFSIEPIPSRASWCARESSSRDHGDIPVYKKRRNERARGRWDLCGYYAIGCRRYTDCLVALRRGSEQTNRCSALSFIGLSPMLIDSRNRFTSFSTPRPVCFDFGGVRIDLRGEGSLGYEHAKEGVCRILGDWIYRMCRNDGFVNF